MLISHQSPSFIYKDFQGEAREAELDDVSAAESLEADSSQEPHDVSRFRIILDIGCMGVWQGVAIDSVKYR
jgi:hypothetical protein